MSDKMKALLDPKYGDIDVEIKTKEVAGHMALTAGYDLSKYPEIDPNDFMLEEMRLCLASGLLFSLGYDPVSMRAHTLVTLS